MFRSRDVFPCIYHFKAIEVTAIYYGILLDIWIKCAAGPSVCIQKVNWLNHGIFIYTSPINAILQICIGGGGRRDRMVVEFITTCAISAYHHYSFEFESRTWPGVLDTTSRDKVCQWLATDRWFSLGTPLPPPLKLTATI